jgi:hypothetical protein
MKYSEIKEILINSLNPDCDTTEYSGRLEEAGVSFDFRDGFSDKVLGKLFPAGSILNHEVDFLKTLNYVFYRITLPGVAAIVLLLISFFLMEGSLSFNSFLGLSDNYDESIVCLLTGS